MKWHQLFYGIAGTAAQKVGAILGLVLPSLDLNGPATFNGQTGFNVAPTGPNFVGALANLVDGAAVAVNAAIASTFRLTCANNNARVISVPTNGVAGMRIAVVIINTSGGNLTATTFNAAIKQPGITLPATGTNRHFFLEFDGTSWSLVDQSTNNIPN